MRKNFKRTLAVLCAAALTTLSVAVAGNLSSLKTAAEVSPSGEINFGEDKAYLKLNNALKSAPTSVEAEVKMPSTIKDEWTFFENGTQDNVAAASRVSSGTTTASDAPGAGLTYINYSIDSSPSSIYQSLSSPIDISKYNRNELVVSFWVYSSNAGKLADAGRLRLANNPEGRDGDVEKNDFQTIDYALSGIVVNGGWTYVEKSLSDFNLYTGEKEGFSEIRCFKLHGASSTTAKEIRIADVKLSVKKNASEWTLINGNEKYRNGINDASNFQNYSHVTIENDVVAENQLNSEEIVGSDYIKVTTTSDKTFSIVKNLTPPVDVSNYSLEDLELDFWFYTSKGGTVFDGGWLFFSNSLNGFVGPASGAAKGIRAKDISSNLSVGWNHITIPLTKMITDVNTNNKNFSYSDIECLKFHGVKTSEPCVFGLGEVKLVAKTENKVYTSSVDETVYNNGYSVFSNIGSSDTPYALFVTREGKPAFIYNNKMFVLNHNICTGEFVKLGVTVNANGTVTFAVGDNLTATSTGTIDTNVAVAFTKGHSIGADANGDTLMNGSIKNLVVKNGENETGRWELSANKAYPLNAVKDSVGSNDAHFAGIADSNAAVVVEYSNATAGAAPADADNMDGYVFAGWFTDKDCTKAFTGTNAKAYAKYVDKAVLTVKAQIKNDAATAETTSMRFVTTVDSLNYKSVGFVINNVDKTLKTVYSNLYVVGDSSVMTKTPADVSNTSVSAYFAAFTVNNIPKDKYSAEFNVTPYWITLDGTRVSADTVVKTVSQGI